MAEESWSASLRFGASRGFIVCLRAGFPHLHRLRDNRPIDDRRGAALYPMLALLPRESTAALRRSFEAWSIFFQKPTK
jgi:hypothetical protein